MIDSSTNPWATMLESSVRRVDANSIHNLFWMTDLQGNYGFYIKAEKSEIQIDSDIKLKGINLVKRNSKEINGELFLILNQKADWSIFYILCEDLINVCNSSINNDSMIAAVEMRLKRWQIFLMNDNKNSMSLNTQMGLLSELSFLKNFLLPLVGIKEAINSWVGPDFNKQDFSLTDSLIEIKSYKTSNGPKVKISSINQLDSEKEPLFLVSYGLTQSNSGISILTLIAEMNALLNHESYALTTSFENKLISYGYMQGISKEPFYKFKTDNIRFFLVSKDFPKILMSFILPQISSVSYTIDLSQCLNHEIEYSTLVKNLK